MIETSLEMLHVKTVSGKNFENDDRRTTDDDGRTPGAYLSCELTAQVS